MLCKGAGEFLKYTAELFPKWIRERFYDNTNVAGGESEALCLCYCIAMTQILHSVGGGSYHGDKGVQSGCA